MYMYTCMHIYIYMCVNPSPCQMRLSGAPRSRGRGSVCDARRRLGSAADSRRNSLPALPRDHPRLFAAERGPADPQHLFQPGGRAHGTTSSLSLSLSLSLYIYIYIAIIRAFLLLSGVPLILNTSFNLADVPMVRHHPSLFSLFLSLSLYI